ncbi:EAL domain-containing protein [Aestuariibacter halophilus]|uniref:EAL domain-containing protein n=1 Tax=Fluctibacter halophilus TaxID=226011 RepID=A0ABS8GB09_9ALTE|nr:EAL domain-containing protein [Aestuariibacter halophilus]MCC2617765.1 EAL domain-containing protein [Aestuariibacter halophilus]
MWCADCESVEDYFFDQTYFWFFLPTTESFGKLAAMCGDSGLEATQQPKNTICVNVQNSHIGTFLTSLNGCLAGPEFGKAKVTTTQTSAMPDIEAMSRMTTAEVLVRRYQAQWIRAAMENDSYQSWYQPIVHADSSQDELRIFGHEALFRLFDENQQVMPPGMVFPLAEQSDLLYSLDLIARRSAVEHAARGGLKEKIFINFNPSSIYDPAYCLRSTAAAINELGLKTENIVFELTETHKARDMNHLKGILSFYRSSGFAIALDDIGSGWSGLNLMAQLRPDFVKIDMELVQGIDTNMFKQNIVKHLIQLAHDNRIQVIAEGIETAEEAALLRELNADFLQGFYFAKPAPVTDRLSGRQNDEISRGVRPLSQAAKTMAKV